MRLHIIRHGATVTSGDTYAGRSDVALTPEGHRQAEVIADALSGRPVGAVLASPLSRAKGTARPLADRLGLEVQIEPALTEFDFGAYEGSPKAETGLRLRKSHLFEPVPDGESLQDVWIRAAKVLATLDRLVSERKDKEVACFGHFWINRLVYGQAVGLGFEEACSHRGYRPKTGEVLSIDYSPIGFENRP